MKSWLRKLAKGFSRNSEPAAATTWHDEDFQAVPDQPSVADPWAADAAPNALRKQPAPAQDAAQIAQPTSTDELSPSVAPKHGRPTVEADNSDRHDPADEESLLQVEDASPEPPPSTADLPWSATSLTQTEPERAEPNAEAPWGTLGGDDAATTLTPTGPNRVTAAASHADAVSPLEPQTGLAPPSPESELGWDDVSPTAALRDGEAPQLRDDAGTHAAEAKGDDILSPGPPDAPWAEKLPQAASDVEAASEGVTPPASTESFTETNDPDQRERTVPFTDWDDFVPAHAAPALPLPTSTQDDEYDLPEYDPGLSQRLGDADWAAEAPRDSLARQRAAMIAGLLDIASRREAETALQWLEGFFLEHWWSSTFRALEAAALEGLDFPTLQAMAALKDIWAERPEWWLRRTRTVRANLGGTATERMPRGDIALSWRLARRICLARCDFLPEDMIDPDWLAEWYALSPNEPGAGFFPTFLAEKVQALLAEALHEGLIAKSRDYDPPSQGHHRLAPRQPLPCGPDGEMISPVMVDATGQRKKEVKDDS